MSMIAEEKATAVLDACRRAGIMLTTAESCTGGLIAAALTDIAGSSDVVDRGFVTYSNEAKQEMIGVPALLIARVGAVSKEVALAMAEGALAHSRAGVSVAVTGIAGPGGGSEEKPVGLVHIAAMRKDGATLHRECRFGDIGRDGIRHATVLAALELVLKSLPASSSGLTRGSTAEER
ncbi:damage-inducible protein CinA [Paramesorhizobium deserti]|uniref:Damage-inducible protein CinA n=1 Tax=Paramesorhizobium deserti TaxID=1494590 RepID=A0A135HVV3_9HYPH|nr:CinA family protein [Paramesorhizobium deserti]KXF77335.1 damage-inducible protein CinA [Paramesorhizobium deserti]